MNIAVSAANSAEKVKYLRLFLDFVFKFITSCVDIS